MKRLAICSGFLGVFLFSLAVTPAHAGRTNMSNSTGTNTSNNTGTNTSNNTGTNTSNNTGGNTSNQQGYNTNVVLQGRQISTTLRAAKASGNQQEINTALAQAKKFFTSVKRQQTVRSGQAW
jgi:hypothetical protein